MAEQTVQVREPGKHALLHPETGSHIVPTPGEQYSPSDPLVLAHPWAFGTAEQIAAEQAAAAEVTSVPVGPPPVKRGPGRPRKNP